MKTTHQPLSLTKNKKISLQRNIPEFFNQKVPYTQYMHCNPGSDIRFFQPMDSLIPSFPNPISQKPTTGAYSPTADAPWWVILIGTLFLGPIPESQMVFNFSITAYHKNLLITAIPCIVQEINLMQSGSGCGIITITRDTRISRRLFLAGSKLQSILKTCLARHPRFCHKSANPTVDGPG